MFIDDAAHAALSHELIYGNRCAAIGGTALYVDANGPGNPSIVSLENVTIGGHLCTSEGGGNAILTEDSQVTVANSILWANGADAFSVVDDASLTITHSIVDTDFPGTGNQRIDPLFAAPPDDFHLCSTAGRYQVVGSDTVWVTDLVHSPGIDGGDPAASTSAETQPNGARLNRGAYGGTAQASRSR